MRRSVALRIVVLLATEGESTRQRLAVRLGLARASVSHHLDLLHEAGLLRAETRGRERFVRLADPEETRGLLANFTPLPDELEPFERMLRDLVA
jgi:DNA-binding transcriptional ArsR family regulator